MHRLIIALLIALSLFTAAPGYAQDQITGLDRLEIELWPDYDRAALLVLLTGVLPPGTTLPATVRVPISAEADLNAVARISDTSEMVDDITYDLEPGEDGQQFLTFTLPDLRFRIEYYVPYTTEGDEHLFGYTWQSDLEIVLLAVLVQQPLNATNFTTDPAAPTIQPGEGGFEYHAFPETPLVADQPFTVQGRYTLSPPVLSAAALATAQAAGSPPGSSTAVPAVPTGDSSPIVSNWPIILAAVAGLALLAFAAWQLISRRTSSRAAATPARKPKPTRQPNTRPPTKSQVTTKPTAVRFCHQCGHEIQPNDHFCRNCGATLKQ